MAPTGSRGGSSVFYQSLKHVRSIVFRTLLKALGLVKDAPAGRGGKRERGQGGTRDGNVARNYLYVVELDAEVAKWGWVRKLNPSGREDKPVLEVRLLLNKGRPEDFFADGDFSKVSKSSHFKRLMPGMTKGFGRMVEGLSLLESTVERLRSQGHFVANKPPSKRNRVYVIEVDDSVKTRARVQRLNPRANPELPCVYVGQTSKDPEVRFQQHQQGRSWGRDLAGRFMAGHCVRLRPELSKGYPEDMTELDAMKAERELAEKLRKLGYTVIGGH